MALIQRARLAPQSLTPAAVMQLQKAVGNQAVCQLMREIEAMAPQSGQERKMKYSNDDTALSLNSPLPAGDNSKGLSLPAQRKLYAQKQVSSPGNPVIQMKLEEVMVTGITHLVEMHGKSLFKSEEAEELEQGDSVTIETTEKVRSRRGPNQELFREDDKKRGTHIYRWYKVKKIGESEESRNLYIREDTFITGIPKKDMASYIGDSPPSLNARPGKKDAKPRSPESRALDRFTRAYWIPMIENDKHKHNFTPHIATMILGSEIYASGNTGDRAIPKDNDWNMEFVEFVNKNDYLLGKRKDQIKKRSKLKTKLKAQGEGRYKPPGVMDHDAMQIIGSAIKEPQSVKFIGMEQKGPTKHGEMLLQDVLHEKKPRNKDRDLGMPRTRLQQQHISGVLLDCLFCHWAHAIFNEIIGPQMGLQITTSGTHGGIPSKWKAPDWLFNDKGAWSVFVKKLDENKVKYNKKNLEEGYVIVEKSSSERMELPDESDSELENID
ncbi:MAG: hypothetical protein GXY34_07085 [Syntrophomonadaceae bacterium]|nr:hypothetical protein [Syntrophomonadaceae bacterium]